jgi:hypothetical protein
MKDINSTLLAGIKKAIVASRIEHLEIPEAKSIKGPFYHGTCISGVDDNFDTLKSEMSDFGAIWVSPNEWISKVFASNNCDNMGGGIPVVYRTGQNLEKAIPLDQYVINELSEEFGVSDPRDLIPYLEMEGYDGWVTMGSVGTDLYTDIAIFKNDVEIDGMKIFVNGKWSDQFFDVSEINEKMKSDHLERFTRPKYV